MKNPLRYQMTEYDCGPTSLLNAVNFLFEREQIPPELVRSVMLFCLDCFGADGAAGKCGTSCMAMQFLCSWLEASAGRGICPCGQAISPAGTSTFRQTAACAMRCAVAALPWCALISRARIMCC